VDGLRSRVGARRTATRPDRREPSRVEGRPEGGGALAPDGVVF
jgi:hypothetical protein